jgi:FkbM family methyltransferase
VTSPKSRLAGVANRVLGKAGLAIVRRSSQHVPGHGDLLTRVRRLGVQPATAIDVGAASGQWTLACREAFPDVRSVLIEPLDEFAEPLQRLARDHAGVAVVQAVASNQAGTAVLNVHADLVGSSVFREAEGAGTDGHPRTVRAVTVDGVIAELRLPGPFLLKVDTQGAELVVLAGAQTTLSAAELVVLEVSLLPFFDGGPLLDDVVGHMRARGFVAYDVLGPTYRPLDGALAQVDIAFVPAVSRLRGDARFATPEQREAQNRRLRAGR